VPLYPDFAEARQRMKRPVDRVMGLWAGRSVTHFSGLSRGWLTRSHSQAQRRFLLPKNLLKR